MPKTCYFTCVTCGLHEHLGTSDGLVTFFKHLEQTEHVVFLTNDAALERYVNEMEAGKN